MNKGQNYVVRCHTKVKGSKVGLGNKTFLPGTYVTYEGDPTNDLNKAHVYTHLECDDLGEWNQFPFEDSDEVGYPPSDFFSPVPVRLVVEILT